MDTYEPPANGDLGRLRETENNNRSNRATATAADNATTVHSADGQSLRTPGRPLTS